MTVSTTLHALAAAYFTAGALLGVAMLLAPWWPVRLWGGAVVAGSIVSERLLRRVLLGRWT